MTLRTGHGAGSGAPRVEAARATRPVERVCWRDVVRVLPDPETRSCALSAFRGSGFDADSFGTRRSAREALADALTRAEDWLELTYPRSPRRQAERAAIRELRRRLEGEVS